MLYLFRTLLYGIIFSLLTCGQEEPDLHDKVPYVDRADYYYDYGDDVTVTSKEDTVIIVNKRLDTTIITTGILTWLRYDYPVVSNPVLVYYAEHAQELEKLGRMDSARIFYRLTVDYHIHKRAQDEARFSDGNDYLTSGAHSAILYSYAYEKLGNIDQSIAVLTRFLANYATSSSRIQERYIRQCIIKYGKATVLKAIESSAASIHYKKDGLPGNCYWVVNILGADMGVAGEFDDGHVVTVQQADQLIRKSDFYKYARNAVDLK